jgi:membrane-associated protease RseP (regulator of RpoE activity)
MDDFFNRTGDPSVSPPSFYTVRPLAAPVYRPKYKLNLFLFLATFLSTLIIGTELGLSFRINGPTAEGMDYIKAFMAHPGVLFIGFPFAFTIMGILLAHELGHYFACRYYGIAVTLPYFLPFPNYLGTMGAFIRIHAPFQNRRALFDVGIAGPLAGFLFAVPALLISLPYSRVVPVSLEQMSISLGEPLIFKLAAWMFHVQAPLGKDIYLHPVAFAAWGGLLVTALNLLPMGQLDGGHIIYALFGRYHRQVSRFFVFVVIPIMMYFWWVYWVVWAIIPLALGINHPSTLNDDRPLDPWRKAIAVVGLIVFILSFMPAPLKIN